MQNDEQIQQLQNKQDQLSRQYEEDRDAAKIEEEQNRLSQLQEDREWRELMLKSSESGGPICQCVGTKWV
jgi:hypothetical protein